MCNIPQKGALVKPEKSKAYIKKRISRIKLTYKFQWSHMSYN
jgi:hypothetical protein